MLTLNLIYPLFLDSTRPCSKKIFNAVRKNECTTQNLNYSFSSKRMFRLDQNFKISDEPKPEDVKASKKFNKDNVLKPSELTQILGNRVLGKSNNKNFTQKQREISAKRLNSDIFGNGKREFQATKSCKKFELKKDNMTKIISYSEAPNFKVYVRCIVKLKKITGKINTGNRSGPTTPNGRPVINNKIKILSVK